MAILVLLTSTLFGGETASDCSLVSGWAQKGEREEFFPDNLFDYMNGNAEGYFVFGFQKLSTVTCVSGGNRIVIDISEMESPELAYGIFTANRHPRHEILPIGTAGQVMPRRAAFSKGNLYIEITASGDRDQTETLRDFCTALDQRLEGSTALPAEINWFPETGLEPGSIRLVPESVLGLNKLGRGYLASYDLGRAFIVTKESPSEAAAVLSYLKEHLSGVSVPEAFDNCLYGRDKRLGLIAVGRKGNKVAGFSNLEEGMDWTGRMKELLSRIP